MKLIERFRPRAYRPKKDEPRFSAWESWIDCDDTIGLTQGECVTLLREWGYVQDQQDSRIWKQVDMMGLSHHRIVDDNFDVDSYNKVLAE